MRLKESLLFEILKNSSTDNKFSKAFLNLKNVVELEKQESFKIPKNIGETYLKLEKEFLNFFEKIPLNVVEKYYNVHKQDLNKFVFLSYKGVELNREIQVIEIYNLLESYFEDVFKCAVQLASAYNLEIKFNTNAETNYI